MNNSYNSHNIQPYIEDEIDLRVYLSMLIRWWKPLLLSIIISAGASYIISQYIPPTYETTVTLMLGQLDQTSDVSLSQINTALRLVQQYSTLVTRRSTLQSVLDELNIESITLEQLEKAIDVHIISNSQIFEITVKQSNPKLAQMLANELANQVIKQNTRILTPEEQNYLTMVKEQLAQLQSEITSNQELLDKKRRLLDDETDNIKKQSLDTEIEHAQSLLFSLQNNYGALLDTLNSIQRMNQLMVIDDAILPVKPIRPRPILNATIAASIALMLAIFTIFIWEYINDTFDSSDDVYRKLNLTTLASVPRLMQKRDNITLTESTLEDTNYHTDVYRMLRTSIEFSPLLIAHPAKTFLITSAIESEGKSNSASNLAIAIARTGKKVVLIDTDSYRPNIHKLFGFPNQFGWANFVLHKKPLHTLRQNTNIDNLQIITSGSTTSNISDFLSPESLQSGIAELSEYVDLIIFDSAPILPVSDSRILMTQVDITILVIKAHSTRTQLLTQTLDICKQVGVAPLGVILNNVENKHTYYYSNYSARS